MKRDGVVLTDARHHSGDAVRPTDEVGDDEDDEQAVTADNPDEGLGDGPADMRKVRGMDEHRPECRVDERGQAHQESTDGQSPGRRRTRCS